MKRDSRLLSLSIQSIIMERTRRRAASCSMTRCSSEATRAVRASISSFVTAVTGVASAERKRIVDEVLDKIQIAHRRNHYPQQLSGGQQQRVAVARAVVNKPRLILADEPTGNLDSRNGNEVMQLLTDLNEQGTTIIMVTHSEHDARYTHRVINMLDGQIVTQNIKI